MHRSFRIYGFACLVIVGALTASAAGCGYRVAGSASQLPPGIHSIAVPAFVNRTSNYRVEQRLTNAVIHELLARTKFRVVSNPEAGDAVIHGEVISLEAGPQVFDPVTGRATTILVTVRMKASLEERSTGKILYHDDEFLFREPYEISTDIPSFFQEEGPALDRMSRDFASRLVAEILENF